MKRSIWKSSLALSLGLLAAGARGEEGPWRAVASTPAETARAPAVTPAPAGRLIAQTPDAEGPAVVAPPAPAAVLARPMAVGGATPADPQVRPASFDPAADRLTPVARGKGEETSLRPMPSAPASAFASWRQGDRPSDEPLPPPRPVPAQTPPLPQGTIQLPGTPTPGLVPGGPIVMPGGPVVPHPDAGACCDGSFGGACGDCGAAGCCGCGGRGCCPPGNRFYASAEFLLWWVKGDPVPPLVTSGAFFDPMAGVLGSPTTQVLFGDRRLGRDVRPGGRFTVGWWFNDQHDLGIEAGTFFLGKLADHFAVSSLGSPILARPIVDLSPVTVAGGVVVANPGFGLPSAEGVANLFTVAGSVAVDHHSSLWGWEVNLRRNCLCGCNYYLDFLAGFRELGLDEGLTITESLIGLGTALGTTVTIHDRFDAQNRFYGPQVGADFRWRFAERWSLDVWSKLAMGPTQQVTRIAGDTTIAVPGALPVTGTGGLLALRSNIGTHVRDRFTVVPEAGVNVGYQFTERLRASLGYNFLYWSSVARPGNAIDLGVNKTLQPFSPVAATGPARPAFPGHGSDFWAQGLTFGLEFKY